MEQLDRDNSPRRSSDILVMPNDPFLARSVYCNMLSFSLLHHRRSQRVVGTCSLTSLTTCLFMSLYVG